MAEHDTSPDAELQLKKRARRRLVGAAALALFAVIVLPMVMDREPRPMSQDIQVRIPSQNSPGFVAKVLPGKPAATPMPAPKLATDIAPGKESAKNAEPKATTVVPEIMSAASQAPSTAATPENKSGSAEKPAVGKTAEPKAKSEVSEQWVVQLGAYREQGNVKTLLAKLKGLRIPAYTEKYESPQGPRTRVRAGPFNSRQAAEKAQKRIKIIGVDGPVAQK
ncbi:MAG: SPOR domain-containing protein [Sulfuritalea sp.]|nr:SPOR domain-containing protein [Sulfuritalea sp.]